MYSDNKYSDNEVEDNRGLLTLQKQKPTFKKQGSKKQ